MSAIISNAKNELVTPSELAEVAQGPVQRAAVRIFPLYEKALKTSGALDFDDLIARTVQLLSTHEQVREKWRSIFKYVMIDEYQDTNAAQYKLVKLVTNEKQNICVVGDDWQSIYSWRGADFRNILNFERDYPSATIIKLEQNYRSTKPILDAAHKVISKNSERSDKKLWTAIESGSAVQVIQAANERNEAELIIRRIRTQTDMRARTFSDFAVLYRTNAQSRSIEEQFVRFGIPYRIFGGVRFYDRKEIKDLVAYLRVVYQPEDSASFERIYNYPARSIGAVSHERFQAWRTLHGYGQLEALERVDECVDLPPKARESFKDLSYILRDFRQQSETMPVAELIEKLIKRLNYYSVISDGSVQGESRVENVKELLSVAKGYSDMGLSGFLEEVSLVSETDSKVFDDTGSVSLMTLHSAKGLEFPVVFLVGMEEGVFPHSRALYDPSEMEEERRLAYVGMTRAKEELFLTYATSRALFGSLQHNPPSQFLTDVEASHALPVRPQFGETKGSPTLSNEPRYTATFEVGDAVRHSVFGVGSILELEGEVAVIYFKQKGAKKLNIAFAPLEKV